MKTEERPQTTPEELRFDAHEFDGLRDELAAQAEGLFAKADEFIRDNPWLCIGIAAAAGCAVAYLLNNSRSCDTAEAEPPR